MRKFITLSFIIANIVLLLPAISMAAIHVSNSSVQAGDTIEISFDSPTDYWYIFTSSGVSLEAGSGNPYSWFVDPDGIAFGDYPITIVGVKNGDPDDYSPGGQGDLCNQGDSTDFSDCTGSEYYDSQVTVSIGSPVISGMSASAVGGLMVGTAKDFGLGLLGIFASLVVIFLGVLVFKIGWGKVKSGEYTGLKYGNVRREGHMRRKINFFNKRGL